MSDESRPEAAGGTPKRKGRVKKKHTIGRVILGSVLVLSLVTALASIYLVRRLDGNLDVRDPTEALGTDRPEEIYKGNGEPLDILVLGDDSREGENSTAVKDNQTGGGSDTTILVHLSADRTRAYAVSIPRDSIVDRPECGVDDQIPAATDVQWNEAFSVGAAQDAAPEGGGGPACTQRQLEATTKVLVEHYVAVDFSGFQDMVDAVDGVPVCVPEEINDPSKGIYVPKGDPALLKGDQALDYVRVRSKVGDQSDLGRIKRQQTFIAALVNKVKSAGTLSRLDRVVRFLDAATSSLEVSTGLGSTTRLGKLAMQLQSIGLEKVQFVTVPTEYSADFNRLYWTEEAKELWRLIRMDKPLPKKFLGGAITAAKPPGASETPAPTDPTGTETPAETPSETPSPTETSSPPDETPSEPTGTATPSAPSDVPTVSPEEAADAGLCS